MMCDPKALTASFSMNIFHMMLCAADVNGKGMIKNRQGKMYHWLSKDPPPHVWIDAAHKSTHNIYSHDAWKCFLLKYYICILQILCIFYQSFHCHDKKSWIQSCIWKYGNFLQICLNSDEALRNMRLLWIWDRMLKKCKFNIQIWFRIS